MRRQPPRTDRALFFACILAALLTGLADGPVWPLSVIALIALGAGNPPLRRAAAVALGLGRASGPADKPAPPLGWLVANAIARTVAVVAAGYWVGRLAAGYVNPHATPLSASTGLVIAVGLLLAIGVIGLSAHAMRRAPEAGSDG